MKLSLRMMNICVYLMTSLPRRLVCRLRLVGLLLYSYNRSNTCNNIMKCLIDEIQASKMLYKTNEMPRVFRRVKKYLTTCTVMCLLNALFFMLCDIAFI